MDQVFAMRQAHLRYLAKDEDVYWLVMDKDEAHLHILTENRVGL